MAGLYFSRPERRNFVSLNSPMSNFSLMSLSFFVFSPLKFQGGDPGEARGVGKAPKEGGFAFKKENRLYSRRMLRSPRYFAYMIKFIT